MTLSMQECMRWYGPEDSVSLSDIRQAGASGIYTSLHELEYGEVWPQESIRARKRLIEDAGLKWVAVESLPLHEEIKTRNGNFKHYINNYKQSLKNLGAEGIDLVIYNFMPVLDWVRTDLAYRLKDGSECLFFDPVQFAAFEIYMLQRPGSENDYTTTQLEAAKEFYASMSDKQRAEFCNSIIDIFPGKKMSLKLEDIHELLAKYKGTDANTLKQNHYRFLQEVIPIAEEVGVKMAVHPDDPPFPILGLPRIVSTADDVRGLLGAVESPSNGICLCTGSFSPRASNDLPAMVREFGSRIHCTHLRSTQRNPDGSFYEASHLGGSIDMFEIVRELLLEMKRRQDDGRKDWQIPFRPDHGHTILDDLNKKRPENPGYSAIGRLKGLAELRGLQLGIARSFQK